MKEMQTKTLLLPVLALGAVATQAQAQKKAAPKAIADGKVNVVFFMCDQMSAMALPIYGNNFLKTPNIDRMAREGVTFMNSICVVPFSSPSRASLITGLYPNVHGILSNVDRKGDGIDPKFPSTEMILNAKGYATGHFGKWHLGDPGAYPCYQGAGSNTDGIRGGYADERAALNPTPAPAKPGEVMINANAYQGYGFYQTAYMHDKAVNGDPAFKKELTTIGRMGVPVDMGDWSLVVRDGIDFIRANKDKPFMATISLVPPHAPFCIFDPYYAAVDPAKIPLSPTSWDTNPRTNYYINNRNFVIGQYLGETGMRERMRCYYGEILYVDDMLGRVLKALDDLKLTGNTVVVFTTDHGDPLASHGLLYGKTIDGFVEELTRTPMVIRLPGEAHAGLKVQATFNSMDLPPTLLDITGQPIPSSMQGRSFMPVIDGKEKDNVGFGYSMRVFARQIRGEVNGKIYTYSKVFSGFKDNGVREELYNVTDDPYQQKDLIKDPKYASVIATMKAEFNKFADKYGDWHIEDMPAKGPYAKGNYNQAGKLGESVAPAAKGGVGKGAASKAAPAGKAGAAGKGAKARQAVAPEGDS